MNEDEQDNLRIDAHVEQLRREKEKKKHDNYNRIKEQRSIWIRNNINKYVYDKYKTSAKNRKHTFELSEEDFVKLIHQSCHYCGLPYSPSNLDLKVNGVDRVDNHNGYVLENCVPCCSECNMAKGRKSYAEFLAWLQRISNFQNTQNSTM